MGNTSLKNFSFSPLKGFVMIADHMYIHYNNPETKGQFNNVAVFTVRETYVMLMVDISFPARIKI